MPVLLAGFVGRCIDGPVDTGIRMLSMAAEDTYDADMRCGECDERMLCKSLATDKDFDKIGYGTLYDAPLYEVQLI